MWRKTERLLLLHLVLVLPAPVCAVASALNISMFIYVSNVSGWRAARDYCREHYSDLVTIRNANDTQKLVWQDTWIGLYLDLNDVWKWSSGDENATFFSWDSGEPQKNHSHTCVHKSSLKWRSSSCGASHPSICMEEKLILVQEMKTWEDAMLHCRKLKTSNQYDLASLPETDNALLDREAIALNASTYEVWVGLRFLAGQWFWLSGEVLNSPYLPQCPAQNDRCGALVSGDQQWTIMDCAEKRNFLCMKL